MTAAYALILTVDWTFTKGTLSISIRFSLMLLDRTELSVTKVSLNKLISLFASNSPGFIFNEAKALVFIGSTVSSCP